MTDFVFIDSGTGGIPYMTELLNKKPESTCVYIADNANFPYGQKTHEEVVGCVLPLVKRLCKQFEPAVIILACNTISVNALEELRRQVPDQQFVGTVPAIKLAASISKTRKLGLLATNATVENPYNDELMKSFAGDCTLVKRPDAALIDFIEKKSFTATRQEILDAVKPAADFFRSSGCDAVILGCTHFLNIKNEIQQALGPDIKVVDSVDGVVRHAIEVHAGVLGAEPLGEGVVDKTAAERGLGNEGKAFPSLFMTGSLDDAEMAQYEALAARLGIKKINFFK
ncbi:MAG: glutamate racemase [Treponema sp.]|nr:glutamate racemase [Treponema sp.]